MYGIYTISILMKGLMRAEDLKEKYYRPERL